jgi:hypothetical protein
MDDERRDAAMRKQRETDAAMRKHRETFRRHGFGDYMIDFGDTTAEAIEAMATALVALEARSTSTASGRALADACEALLATSELHEPQPSPATSHPAETIFAAHARGCREERARIATRLRTRADSLDALGGNSYASMILRAESDAFSEADVYVDARGRRHSRGCDVAVYDDAHKPCSHGCNASDPGAPEARPALVPLSMRDTVLFAHVQERASKTLDANDQLRLGLAKLAGITSSGARESAEQIEFMVQGLLSRLEDTRAALDKEAAWAADLSRALSEKLRQNDGSGDDAPADEADGDAETSLGSVTQQRLVVAKNVMLRLPHSETAPEKLYSFPNPDTLIVAFRALNQEVYLFADDEQRSRNRVTVSYEHVAYVLMLAHAYLDLTMYELGQEHCVEKLRDIWRARRVAAKE